MPVRQAHAGQLIPDLFGHNLLYFATPKMNLDNS